MKHLPTNVLLDLADDYQTFSKRPWPVSRQGAMEAIARIDAELLSRMPEGEFVTVYDFTFLPNAEGETDCTILVPIGFEPYMGEDNEYDNHLSLDDFNRQGFYD